MSKLKTLVAIVAVISLNANANASLEADFSQCAESALASKQLKAKSVRLDIPSKSAGAMDHNPSERTREYYMEMKFSGKGSSENIGRVRCSIDQAGNVTSVNFES